MIMLRFLSLTTIEVTVQRLHEYMNLLQNDKFVHLHWSAHYEVQARISPVHEFEFPLLDYVAHLSLTG